MTMNNIPEQYQYEKDSVKHFSDKLLNFALYLRQSHISSDVIFNPMNDELEYQMYRIKKELWDRRDASKMIS